MYGMRVLCVLQFHFTLVYRVPLVTSFCAWTQRIGRVRAGERMRGLPVDWYNRFCCTSVHHSWHHSLHPLNFRWYYGTTASCVVSCIQQVGKVVLCCDMV